MGKVARYSDGKKILGEEDSGGCVGGGGGSVEVWVGKGNGYSKRLRGGLEYRVAMAL